MGNKRITKNEIMNISSDELDNKEANLALANAAIEHSGLYFWDVDIVNKVAREGYLSVLNYGLPEVMENYPESLFETGVVADSSIEDYKQLHRDLENGKNYTESAIQLLDKNKEKHWFKIKYTAIEYDEDGMPIRAIGTSERMDIDKELEQMFSIAAKQSGIATWTYNIKTNELETYDTDIIPIDNVHPVDREKVDIMHQKISEGSITAEEIIRWKPSDKNDWRWVKINYTVLFNKKNIPEKAIGSAIDITREKRTEERYKKEVIYRKVMTKGKGIYMQINLSEDSIEDIIGVPKDLRKYFEADTYSDLVARLTHVAKTKAESSNIIRTLSKTYLIENYNRGLDFFSSEYEINTDAQKRIKCSVNTMLEVSSQNMIAFISIEDITEERLKTNLINHLIDTDYDYVIVIDVATGKYKNYTERAYFDMPKFGIYDDLIALANREYVSEVDQKRVLEEMSLDTVIKKLASQESYACYHRQGTEKAYRQKKRTFQYIENETGKIVVTGLDITDDFNEKQIRNEALNKALKKAERASVAKSEFFSRMSHEIRTPMNAIIGLTNIAKNETFDKEVMEMELEKIDASAKFLLALINDILDMSRIESGNMFLVKEPFDSSEFLDGISTIIKTQAMEKDITFTTDFKVPEENYMDDKIKLQQVLMNILGNAIKFTKPGGRIEMKARKLGNANKTSVIRFMIIDNGCGIKKDFLPKIFDAFAQEDAGNTTVYGGTGLGLAICSNIVKLMGGTINVQSKEGEGSTFTVDIKLNKADEKARGVKQSKKNVLAKNSLPDYEFKDMRVLVAEDHPMNVEVARKLLENKGFKVEVASNGLVAFEMYKKAEPKYYDIILMDIRMPIMDGLAATRKIREYEKEKGENVPIIAMTANAFAEDVEKSKESGMVAHLAKPIDPQLLYDTINKFTRNRQ